MPDDREPSPCPVCKGPREWRWQGWRDGTRLRRSHCADCTRETRRDYQREYKRDWNAKHPDRAQKTARKWSGNNRVAARTHQKVYYAITVGKLEKKPCQVCGNPKVDAHHEDYSKPLEVIWLCRKHHREIHKKN